VSSPRRPRTNSSYLPRCLDHLGIVLLSRPSAALCPAAIDNGWGRTRAMYRSIAPNFPAALPIICAGHLDILATRLWPGNGAKHVCPDRPPYKLGLNHRLPATVGPMADGEQLSSYRRRRDGGG